METFRQEIIEAQKVRSDLLKQKLILNAVLGGVGLGLTRIGTSRGLEAARKLESIVKGAENHTKILEIQTSLESIKLLFDGHFYLVLCLIPLVCAYIDLLCNHQDLKMLIIAKFLKVPHRAINKDKKNLESEHYQLYETICETTRDIFSLEQFALKACSITLCLLLIILPFIIELDIQNPSLDNYCLTISGILGIIFAMWVNSHANHKKRLLYFNEQSLEREEENRKYKEYKKYLDNFCKIEKACKIARAFQIVLIFGISIFFIICAYYTNYIKYIKLTTNNDCYFKTSLKIIDNIPNKNLLVCCGFIMMIVWAILYCSSIYVCKEFAKLKKLPEESDFINRCYQFLMNKNITTDITALSKKSEKYLNCLLIIFLVFCIGCVLFTNENYISSNIARVLQNNNSSIYKYIFKALDIILCMIGVAFLSWFTLAPGLHNCFSNYLNEIYKFKSFLPTEIGEIQKEFVVKIEKETTNSDFTITNEIHKEYKENYICLLLIKCRNGIAIVNPENEFISCKNYKIIVENSSNIDDLPTGNYWEIGFNFPMKIVRSNLNDNSQIQYEFKDWKKISDVDKTSDGIEIGEKTALFFVCTD